MYSIRQEELFSFRELMAMSPGHKYSKILEALDITPLLRAVQKITFRGRPTDLNYAAMIYSLLIGRLENMDHVKHIIARINSSEEFRYWCQFRGSDRVPSEASYSRLCKALAESGVLEAVQLQLVKQAMAEGFIGNEALAIDSTYIVSWKNKPDDPKPASDPALFEMNSEVPAKKMENPKKKYSRGRPSKAEAAKRKAEREAYEASLPLFERKTEEHLKCSYEELRDVIPTGPTRSAKNGSDGRLFYWHGFKMHPIVETSSQYIMVKYTTSAHVSDMKMAIPLMKKLEHHFPNYKAKYALMDAAYDGLAIYQQIRNWGALPLIDFNEHSRTLPEGRNEDFTPICKEGHAYRYDSYDGSRDTTKFTSPKECATCPFAPEGSCNKVVKIKITQDLRRYTAPARGSQKYKELYSKRTAVERVFSHLKGSFNLERPRCSASRVAFYVDLSVLCYTLCKLAIDRMNKELMQAAA